MPQPSPAAPKIPAAPAAAAAAAAAGDAIVAKASHHWRDYRAKKLVMIVGLITLGLWFGYDGFVGWPRENAKIEQLKKDVATAHKAADEDKARQLDVELRSLTEHGGLSIRIQKILAFTLPPLGILLLGWSLYHSRGVYRLANNTLQVPGHPPIPLDAVRSIDKTDWDRKGIAYINYELPNGTTGSARLDDFIYERVPTDDIFHKIEQYTGTADPAPTTPAAP